MTERPTPALELAESIGLLVERFGTGGGWVVASLKSEGPLFAKLVLIDAELQRRFAVIVEETS